MSPDAESNTCKYSFDSRAWGKRKQTDIIDQWTWKCPYDQHSDSEYCIFHMSPSERSASEITHSELRERFISDVLRNEGRLHGATIDKLELDYLTPGERLNRPINIRANSFGDLSFGYAHVTNPIQLDYCHIENLNVSQATFDNALAVQRASITDTFDASLAEIEWLYAMELTVGKCNLTEVELTRASFEEAAIEVFKCPHAQLSLKLDGVHIAQEMMMNNATLTKLVDCRTATFECTFDLTEVQIEDNLRCSDSTFHKGVDISETHVENVGFTNADIFGDLRITDCTLKKLVLDKAEISGQLNVKADARHIKSDQLECAQKARFGPLTANQVDIHNCIFPDLTISSDDDGIDRLHCGSLELNRLNIMDKQYGDLLIWGCEISDFYVNDATVETLSIRHSPNAPETVNAIGGVRFRDATIETFHIDGTPIDKAAHIQFIEGDVQEATLNQPNEGSFIYSFHKSTIGEIESRNPNGPDLRFVHFMEVNFDGFPFQKYSHELQSDWILNTGPGINLHTFEMTPDEWMRTYQSARADAAISHKEAARSGFRKQEMNWRKHAYWEQYRTQRDARSLSNWLEIQTLDFMAEYGENSWRPVKLALLSLGGFGLIFSGVGFANGSAIFESLVYGMTLSFQSFATLIFKPGTEFSGSLIRFLMSLEGVFATLLIPFLVFALTKSVD